MLGERLRLARLGTLPPRRRGPWSVYELASSLGLSWEVVAAWESGVLTPTTVELAMLEKALGLKRGALLEGDGRRRTAEARETAPGYRAGARSAERSERAPGPHRAEERAPADAGHVRPPASGGRGGAPAFRVEEAQALVDGLRRHNPQAGRLEDPLRAVLETERLLARHVFRRLEAAFGPEESGWWVKGVPLPVRVNAATLRENDPKRLDPRAYVYLIELKKVVLSNWKLFEDPFCAEPERSKDDNLSWMNRLNALRNSLAHAVREEFGERIAEDELEFVAECRDWARRKLA